LNGDRLAAVNERADEMTFWRAVTVRTKPRGIVNQTFLENLSRTRE